MVKLDLVQLANLLVEFNLDSYINNQYFILKTVLVRMILL